MKQYPKYKASKISWIGDVPEHWENKRLFSVAKPHFISNKTIHHQNLLSLSYGKIIRKNIINFEKLLEVGNEDKLYDFVYTKSSRLTSSKLKH